MDKVPMTTYGYAKMEKELHHRTRTLRPQIIDDIEEARAHGDLSENAEYHAAKERQAINEGMIKNLESKLSRADVVDPKKMSGKKIMMSATVKVVDEDDKESTYILVGPEEADLEKGLISISSPLGRAMIGKEEEDEFTFNAPGGSRTYEVLEVNYQEINV
ncbi:MAG: transcription elongation factor GreA [Magnetococcales bacterium]|nr:transcription elongation factor GreA [Magnetococcales bacterium]|tara:strand:- start:1269 stop:1751 length:483 start_codon:yes stop_codon:yes gene_type:complete